MKKWLKPYLIAVAITALLICGIDNFRDSRWLMLIIDFVIGIFVSLVIFGFYKDK